MLKEIRTQRELLVSVMNMVIESGVCPDTTPQQWSKIILDAHTRGYLYAHFNGNTLDAVVCAYRTHKMWSYGDMPVSELGDELYIDWAVSTTNNKTVLLRMLRSYLRENKDIKKVFYYRRNSDTDLREWRLK